MSDEKTFRVNNSKVAVALDVYWYDMATCPLNTKVLLLSVGGVGVIGTYNGKDPFWEGWFPMPRVRKNFPSKTCRISHPDRPLSIEEKDFATA